MGTKFDLHEDSLELGHLTTADYVNIFGKPYSKRIQTTKDGDFETVSYQYAESTVSSASTRVLLLEFRNQKLNAYEYVSSFDHDKTKVELEKLDAIKTGIGKLTKKDIVSLLGKPNGECKCPSKLDDFKDRCGEGAEIWAWFAAKKIDLWAKGKFEAASIYLLFNSDGKLIDVQTENSTSPVRLR